MLRRAGSALLWLVLLVAVLLLVTLVAVPRLIGATPYTVVSGSMAPTFPTGSVVVVRPIVLDAVQQGDVITFQLAPGRPQVVTHRVVGIDVVDGAVRLQTQGDANRVPDPATVREEQLRGRVAYHVPWVGHLSSLVPSAARETLATVVGVGLLGYAGVLVVGALRTRRQGAVSGSGERPDHLLPEEDDGAERGGAERDDAQPGAVETPEGGTARHVADDQGRQQHQ